MIIFAPEILKGGERLFFLDPKNAIKVSLSIMLGKNNKTINLNL
jgi:hypothetical protein